MEVITSVKYSIRPVTKSNLSVFTESPCFSEGD